MIDLQHKLLPVCPGQLASLRACSRRISASDMSPVSLSPWTRGAGAPWPAPAPASAAAPLDPAPVSAPPLAAATASGLSFRLDSDVSRRPLACSVKSSDHRGANERHLENGYCADGEPPWCPECPTCARSTGNPVTTYYTGRYIHDRVKVMAVVLFLVLCLLIVGVGWQQREPTVARRPAATGALFPAPTIPAACPHNCYHARKVLDRGSDRHSTRARPLTVARRPAATVALSPASTRLATTAHALINPETFRTYCLESGSYPSAPTHRSPQAAALHVPAPLHQAVPHHEAQRGVTHNDAEESGTYTLTVARMPAATGALSPASTRPCRTMKRSAEGSVAREARPHSRMCVAGPGRRPLRPGARG